MDCSSDINPALMDDVLIELSSDTCLNSLSFSLAVNMSDGEMRRAVLAIFSRHFTDIFKEREKKMAQIPITLLTPLLIPPPPD